MLEAQGQPARGLAAALVLQTCLREATLIRLVVAAVPVKQGRRQPKDALAAEAAMAVTAKPARLQQHQSPMRVVVAVVTAGWGRGGKALVAQVAAGTAPSTLLRLSLG